MPRPSRNAAMPGSIRRRPRQLSQCAQHFIVGSVWRKAARPQAPSQLHPRQLSHCRAFVASGKRISHVNAGIEAVVRCLSKSYRTIRSDLCCVGARHLLARLHFLYRKIPFPPPCRCSPPRGQNCCRSCQSHVFRSCESSLREGYGRCCDGRSLPRPGPAVANRLAPTTTAVTIRRLNILLLHVATLMHRAVIKLAKPA
jgi:hypothetical protein